MFKKILGLVICVVTVVSMVTPVSAAKDTAWKADALRELGVYQDNLVTYDGFITSLAGFLYENPTEMGGAEAVARDIGMLEAGEKYEGQKTLTVGEALKLAVITLGYKPALGTDGNYVQKASELGIADGISANGDIKLKADVAANILYSMIDADPLVKTYTVKEGTTYAVAYDNNLLSINRKIYEIKGILTGTETTSIYGPESKAKTDCVAINEVSYFVGEESYDHLLGKNVLAYAQKGEDLEDTILYIGEVERKNETLIIDCEDIIEQGWIGNKLSYITYQKTNEKIKRIDFNGSPRVIYNGMFLEEPTEADIAQGVLEIIDNSSDKKYDVIKVSAYSTMIVESIDSREMLIRNRYRLSDVPESLPELNLNTLKNSDIKVRIFDSTGSEVDFSAIKVDDVLSIAMSKNGNLIDIYISGVGYISGVVTGINTTDDLVYIDREEFKKNNDFKSYLANAGKTVKLGETYTFYIDHFGKIAYIKEAQANNYNVLVKVSYDEYKDEYNATYMDMNGDWYTSPISEKAKFDGVKPQTYQVYEDKLEELKGKDPQVVILRFNANNQIINIDTADETSDSEFNKKTATNYVYRSNDRYFHAGNDIVYLENKAKVIVFPTEGFKNKENWRIYSAGSFFQGDNTYDSFNYYNIDKFKFTDLITVTQSKKLAQTNKSVSLYVVTGFEQILVDGDPYPVIKGSVDGFMNLSFVGKSANVFDDVERGDVINFSLDQNGKIDYVEKRFALTDFEPMLGAIYSHSSLHAGKVLNIDYEEGKMMLSLGNGTEIPFRLDPSMQVTVYNGAEGCESMSIDAIGIGNNVLLRTTYGKISEIICVKN